MLNSGKMAAPLHFSKLILHEPVAQAVPSVPFLGFYEVTVKTVPMSVANVMLEKKNEAGFQSLACLFLFTKATTK